MIKPSLVILSDINGLEENVWMETYTKDLESEFKITLVDVRELAELDPRAKTKDEIHALFLNGGMEIAVNNLLRKQKKPCLILAFSIGGTVAWKRL